MLTYASFSTKKSSDFTDFFSLDTCVNKKEFFEKATSKPELLRFLYFFESTSFFNQLISLADGYKLESNNHKSDLLTHTIMTMEMIENDPVMRLAALFHDIAKPMVAFKDAKGKVHYWGHPETGAKLARELLTEFSYSEEIIKQVELLVLKHDDKIKKDDLDTLIQNYGHAFIEKLLKLKEADLKAKNSSWKDFKVIRALQRENADNMFSM